METHIQNNSNMFVDSCNEVKARLKSLSRTVRFVLSTSTCLKRHVVCPIISVPFSPGQEQYLDKSSNYNTGRNRDL